ncbi:MAG: alkaline phosphatase [Sedimentisphaerales bacterium]|nr:alkaline phosphatase [Sedimentisphaerales bacterium]
MKTLQIKMLVLLAIAAFSAVSVQARPSREYYSGAKYVFLFIGDGMSMAQIHGVEAYLEAEYAAGLDKKDPNKLLPVRPVGAAKLVMTQFPVMGLCTTYDYGSFITDSASAGTALASGKKTLSGVINMSPDFTTQYTSVAEMAKKAGKKIGIITSVSLDHATPASFYAHQNSRSNMYEIGIELANSGFDYFAGGGFVSPTSKKDPNAMTVFDALAANGYTYVDTKAGFEGLTPASGKVVAVNPVLDSSKALPYEIDRKNDEASNISLAEFTRKGIEMIYDAANSYGFFMMVEGGKIDWANHANDARSALDDTLAFDDAIAQAVAFYNEHPNDTLILVTADHDCGGMSLGWAGTAYDNRFDLLNGQTVSYLTFDDQIETYRSGYLDPNGVYTGPADIDEQMKSLILAGFGMDMSTLSLAQNQTIETAFDITMAGQKGDSLLYGGYNPLSVTLTHVLNNNAGIAYTSYAHTGIPVPVMALGKDSYQFEGYYDNTDIAKKMAGVMRLILMN